jgi:antitoxin component of MazEF toxin-antitoxin module
MIYTAKVTEICENGDAIVELPDELVKELDWEIGDTLDYQLEDKSVLVKNLSKEKRDASST